VCFQSVRLLARCVSRYYLLFVFNQKKKKPCYHSRDANDVRVDGAHTLEQVVSQMNFAKEQRGEGIELN
jgi:hypothetical protein